MTLVSGIVGTGHRYFFIGTPDYWLWIGSIASAVEPLPFFLMILYAFSMARQRRIEHDNKVALTWAKGTTVIAFLGAGGLGFLHTLAPVNYFTHGTQLTAEHGHLAFFGAYIMILFTIISYAMPIMRGRLHGNGLKAQKVELTSFWLMVIGMLGVTSALVVAGGMQIFMQRMGGVDAMSFMATQIEIIPVYMVRLGFGVMTFVGLLVYFYSFFVKEEATA